MDDNCLAISSLWHGWRAGSGWAGKRSFGSWEREAGEGVKALPGKPPDVEWLLLLCSLHGHLENIQSLASLSHRPDCRSTRCEMPP